ncbi:hypothetical protein [Chamaesiphon sp. OTE_20_metabat_361]|uniref:hypothetical protein n=2 Tax=unclassified Chamaesiphon TaxID=2620921 RepID=UPI00286AD40E|nr:hypothetical protein [Chamaesiphon sp. OTE_20_metabat_361]
MNTTPQSGHFDPSAELHGQRKLSASRSTLESIVRELEKIPEPIQLSLLDFIRSLSSSYTATNQTETKSVGSQKRDPSRKCRTTSTRIAGKGKTVGDIVSPIVDERDWECLK